MSDLFIYFITGGLFTTMIVAFEESGQRTLSGLATIVPVFTLIAYFFIGHTQGSIAVSQNAKWVLVGTLVAWVPYMLAIIYLSPKIGSHNAILWGLVIFFILAALYIAVVNHFGLFQ